MAGGDAVCRERRRFEAEDELVNTALQILATQAVLDTQRPDLEVGEDAVHPGQDDVGGHLTDDVGSCLTRRPIRLAHWPQE
jgi:hypothetical protein